MSFKAEADQYASFKADGRYPAWLDRLKERIVQRVLQALDRLDESDPDSLLLAYHGLQRSEIEKDLTQLLWDISRQYETGTTPWEMETLKSVTQPVPLTGRQAVSYAKAGIDITNASPLLRMAMASAETPREIEKPLAPVEKNQFLTSQLVALREETNLTTEEIAELIGISARNVYRHLAGTIPRSQQIRAYEEAFTKVLGRPVKLKRHQTSV
jgi:DNA-directed RNA polymerase specialized sigma24 family protein